MSKPGKMPIDVPHNQGDSSVRSTSRLGTSVRSQLNSFTSSSPLASYAIQQDLEDEDDNALSDADEPDSPNTVIPSQYTLAEQYRRPSAVAVGPRSFVLPFHDAENSRLSRNERQNVLDEERSLLRDNDVIPPKHPRKRGSEDNIVSNLSRKLSLPGLRKTKSTPDEESAVGSVPGRLGEEAGGGVSSERTALLGDRPYGGEAETAADVDAKWEQAVLEGKIQTTWQREAKVLAKYSRSLIVTFILQYSLTMASIFTIGHIGKVELGAVSLATMTANITGYAVYQGLATSLDTLCAQAYGSGRKKLVGLQLQRMVYFLLVITIPIGVIWLSAEPILAAIVPEKETARLAGIYLKVLLVGAPGYAAFESGKRFVQAQGLFSANLYVLLICAPINAFMNWLFVWKLKWGFVGAPIAVAITDNLLPLMLFLYVVFVDGKQCWGGFEKRALKNWVPMIKLAVPGLIMVLAEFLAFEILTLGASYLGTTYLAAQSVLGTLTALTFQIPFPVSIAASTRIANLIGATLAGPARVAAKVALVAAVIIGCFNVTLLSSLRNYIPRLFTNDEDVIELVAQVLPLCAAFQLFDSLATNCSGILRGLGRQEIGGYVNLFAYYVVSLIGTVPKPMWQVTLCRLLYRYPSALLLPFIGTSMDYGSDQLWASQLCSALKLCSYLGRAGKQLSKQLSSGILVLTDEDTCTSN